MSLDEESIIRLLWSGFGKTGGRQDPFDDDAAWVKNQKTKRFVVGKADMFVASTDAPPQMNAAQMAKKSIVACVSDLAAKGVRPDHCLVSVGIPKENANTDFVTMLADGFAEAESKYDLRIVGGDTNAINSDTVIDCSIFGFADQLVLRKGAKPGDLVGVSGRFGAQPAGLLILLGKARSSDKEFEKAAVESVLEPRARLDVGLRAAKFLSSCIDSSDGLAISLYHVAESSAVNIKLDRLPKFEGVDRFAVENGLDASQLVLFGGEEYELVCTYPKKNERALSKFGFTTIGVVSGKAEEKPEVLLGDEPIQRKGWLHFKSNPLA
jgi:thiamine-monophosphate kinase